MATADIDATLAERGKRYGDFAGHSKITQDLKDVMRETPGWKRLNPSQRECLEMVAHKAGRILNGDPNYADSWHDMAGYAKLVNDELVAGAVASEGGAPPSAPGPTPPQSVPGPAPVTPPPGLQLPGGGGILVPNVPPPPRAG